MVAGQATERDEFETSHIFPPLSPVQCQGSLEASFCDVPWDGLALHHPHQLVVGEAGLGSRSMPLVVDADGCVVLSLLVGWAGFVRAQRGSPARQARQDRGTEVSGVHRVGLQPQHSPKGCSLKSQGVTAMGELETKAITTTITWYQPSPPSVDSSTTWARRSCGLVHII